MVHHTLVTTGAVVALLSCSAFFSSSETALFTVSREWIASRAESDPRAAAVADLLADPHRLLVTILVGNNVVNIAVSSLVTALLVEQFQSTTAVLTATTLTSGLILIFGEIVPKSYGLGNAQSFSLRIVRPLRYVELVLYPVVLLFDLLTRQITDRLGGQQAIEQPYVDSDALEADRRDS